MSSCRKEFPRHRKRLTDRNPETEVVVVVVVVAVAVFSFFLATVFCIRLPYIENWVSLAARGKKVLPKSNLTYYKRYS